MRLILSHLPDDFDPEADVVAGPWCFASRPEGYALWSRYEFAPDPGESGLDRHKELERCWSYCEHLLAKLVPRLNEINGTEHGIDFWRQVTDFWLISLVQVLYFAQHVAEGLKRMHGVRQLAVQLVPRGVSWKFEDIRAFNNRGVLNADFFAWAVSRFVEAAPAAAWRLEYRTDLGGIGANLKADVAASTSSAAASIKDRLRRIVWRVRVLAMSRCVNVYGVRDWQALLLSLMLSVKRPVGNLGANPVEGEGKPAAPPDFGEPVIAVMDGAVIADLAWEVMPVTFKALSALPPAGWRPRPGKLRIVGPVAVTMDAVKVAIAKSRAAGEYIVGAQHGASYGDARQSMAPYVEFNLDGFITWGWTRHQFYSGNFIPLPSPMLGGKTHKEAFDDVLFVGVVIPLLKPRLDFSPGLSGTIRYVAMKESFLAALRPDLAGKVLYRPQLADNTLNELPFLRGRFPDLRVLDVRPEGRLYSSRLLVLDNPSTMLNIALAANVPTICFWNPRDWEMTNEANGCYDKLRVAGILHDDPVAAAQKVGEVWADVAGWWRQPEVQAARRDWCAQYARSDARWLRIWLRTLRDFDGKRVVVSGR